MKNNVIYKVCITDITVKLCRNYTPYIEIKTETLDSNYEVMKSLYYFSNKAKYFSYKELTNLLNMFNIETDEEHFFNSLNQLIGKEVYLTEMPNIETKYQIYVDYKEKTL